MAKCKMEVLKDGTKVWSTKDERVHRAHGPAIIRPDGSKEWYLHGYRLLKSDFKSVKMVKRMKAEGLFTIEELLGMG